MQIEKQKCCVIPCEEIASFRVQDLEKGKTFEDFNYTCSKHLSDFIQNLAEVERLEKIDLQ